MSSRVAIATFIAIRSEKRKHYSHNTKVNVTMLPPASSPFPFTPNRATLQILGMVWSGYAMSCTVIRPRYLLLLLLFFSFLWMRRFQKGADRGPWRCDSLGQNAKNGPGLKKY
jgi:hypothetical protein